MVSICLFDYCNPLGIITPMHTHILSKYIFSGWKTIEMGFFQKKFSLIKSFSSLFDRHMLFWAVFALEFSFQTTTFFYLWLQTIRDIVLYVVISIIIIIFWPFCCLFFFDIRIMITPLVSPNSYYPAPLWHV